MGGIYLDPGSTKVKNNHIYETLGDWNTNKIVDDIEKLLLIILDVIIIIYVTSLLMWYSILELPIEIFTAKH